MQAQHIPRAAPAPQNSKSSFCTKMPAAPASTCGRQRGEGGLLIAIDSEGGRERGLAGAGASVGGYQRQQTRTARREGRAGQKGGGEGRGRQGRVTKKQKCDLRRRDSPPSPAGPHLHLSDHFSRPAREHHRPVALPHPTGRLCAPRRPQRRRRNGAEDGPKVRPARDDSDAATIGGAIDPDGRQAWYGDGSGGGIGSGVTPGGVESGGGGGASRALLEVGGGRPRDWRPAPRRGGVSVDAVTAAVLCRDSGSADWRRGDPGAFFQDSFKAWAGSRLGFPPIAPFPALFEPCPPASGYCFTHARHCAGSRDDTRGHTPGGPCDVDLDLGVERL